MGFTNSLSGFRVWSCGRPCAPQSRDRVPVSRFLIFVLRCRMNYFRMDLIGRVGPDMAAYIFTFADAFVDITQGMAPYDETNQTHKELLDWVNKEQENFIQGGETGKEGKTFMRRERFYATPENQRTQYYTWTDDDLLNLLVMRAKQRLRSGGYAAERAEFQPSAERVPPAAAL